jgi:hypothetical protein
MGEVLILVLRSRRFMIGAVLFLTVLAFGVIGPRIVPLGLEQVQPTTRPNLVNRPRSGLIIISLFRPSFPADS